MADDSTYLLHPPAYLLEATEWCWKCGEAAKAVCLMGAPTNQHQGEELTDAQELLILSYVSYLPGEFVELVRQRHTAYKLHRSKTTDSEYYTCFCDCGANFGDFFLHKPGHAFFPADDHEAGQIIVWELPIQKPMEVESTFSAGLGDGIFNHGERRAWPL